MGTAEASRMDSLGRAGETIVVAAQNRRDPTKDQRSRASLGAAYPSGKATGMEEELADNHR